jgi:hypothetical protein
MRVWRALRVVRSDVLRSDVLRSDVLPVGADASHWPRSSRDTCNARDAEAGCK